MITDEHIKKLEEAGELDPNCKGCQEIFYPKLREGKELWEIFAPKHKPSISCRSGKYPHCTCDTCF